MVRADWLLEPADPVLCEAMSEFDGLRDCVGAVRIDEQVAVGADRPARRSGTSGGSSVRMCPDLHLYAC